MISGYWLILEDALKLSFKTDFILEVFTSHELHRAHGTGNPSCQPYFTVGAATYFAQHLVIRNNRLWSILTPHLRLIWPILF